jgi:hypothetical protein
VKRIIIVAVLAASTASAGPIQIDMDALGQQVDLPSANGWAQWGIGTVHAWQEFTDSFRALTPFDDTCIDVSSLGAPAVPASCADDADASAIAPGAGAGGPRPAGTPGPGGACGECFRHATNQLNGMRLNLERLRCTYAAYSRFVKASVAFGDNASGIHAVTGLAWQNARAEILAEFDKLKQSYDQKYAAMLPNLRSALEALGQCEAQHFHDNDWYTRFGFIYYTFMSDRYKRSD